MADPHYMFVPRKYLHGKLVDGKFTFDCGFTIPLEQISWLTGETLHDGDEVQFDVTDIQTFAHKHKYQCSCGKVQE